MERMTRSDRSECEQSAAGEDERVQLPCCPQCGFPIVNATVPKESYHDPAVQYAPRRRR